MCGQTDTKFLDMCGQTDTKMENKHKNPGHVWTDQGFILLNFYCNKNAIIANIK